MNIKPPFRCLLPGLTLISIIGIFVTVAGLVGCKKADVAVLPPKTNLLPVARAGTDQVVILPVDSLLLDASASFDPDGSIRSYTWSKISGSSTIVIRNPSAFQTMVYNLETGTYQFELTITDNKGANARDTLKVIVNPSTTNNHPPVANAGADQVIVSPANNVIVDGRLSTDPDNNISVYEWRKISGPLSNTIDRPGQVQTAIGNLTEGIYRFELKVTDSIGLFSKDTVQINVDTVSGDILVTLYYLTWNDPGSCAINIDNVLNNIPIGVLFDVHLRSENYDGNWGPWIQLAPYRNGLPNGYYYEIIADRLRIIAIGLDCNFDVNSYMIRLIAR
jgi:hypothetical protein